MTQIDQVADAVTPGLVRQARMADLPSVVSIHRQAFQHSFLTQMGRGFLRHYYTLVLKYSGGIFLVNENSGRLDGFACGFVDPERFYGQMTQTRWAFALPLASSVLRRPFLMAQIMRSVQRVRNRRITKGAWSCELASLAVRPEIHGRGAGKALVKAFVKEAGALGANEVYLDTDANDNERANRFYDRVGFTFRGRFEKNKGRWMHEYAIHLAAPAAGTERA